MNQLTLDAGVELSPDNERVVARLFLPGESTPGGTSRTAAVLERVLATPADQVEEEAARVLRQFGGRHPALISLLRANAATVAPIQASALSDDLLVVVGAVFTAEFAVETAALCNPSAVAHPDQTGLDPGQLRVVLSLRSIGEPHLSSIQFCEAVIGPGRRWEFCPRAKPLYEAQIDEGRWERRHLIRALGHDGGTDELVRALANTLPAEFGSSAIERAVNELPDAFLHQPGARPQMESIRIVAGSSYQATFPESSHLSQRVLMPYAQEERRGVEDARFVRFTDLDGHRGYRATFTAFSGDSIASRLLLTDDFRTFIVQRLTGPPAQTKGMALFPRPVGGRLLALSRGDGEAISLTQSLDGLDWGPEEPLYAPGYLWDVVQSGNCGPPLETEHGWLVLTHGVGPLRSYSIGALLLDLDDPTHVLGATRVPLLGPAGRQADGYVPNVVYGCGAIIHDDIVWIPHGIADNRIRVASISLASVLAATQWHRPGFAGPGSDEELGAEVQR